MWSPSDPAIPKIFYLAKGLLLLCEVEVTQASAPAPGANTKKSKLPSQVATKLALHELKATIGTSNCKICFTQAVIRKAYLMDDSKLKEPGSPDWPAKQLRGMRLCWHLLQTLLRIHLRAMEEKFHRSQSSCL